MSKVQGGMKCVKYLLFVFNFIFWLSGSLVVGVGLWLRFEPNTLSLLKVDDGHDVPDAPETYFIAVYILIVAGGVMMLVGFFGCCGAVRESQCLLGLFFACLMVIFGAEVAAGVFGFLNREKIINEVNDFYLRSLQGSGNGTSIANMYHTVLQCCGGTEVNPTLCPPDENEETKNCVDAIDEYFNEKLFIIGYVGIGIAGVMIIGMIFSMVLCCAIRNNREVI
ncbi:tetraspanin-2-like [Sardina pilchardus]|uniref:tetraspanin-2-like n=1 Tax=Sardina pilchardus TaxID=27697 RepID=UPI002E13B0FB